MTTIELTEHAEPIEPGHLDVEADQIRPELPNEGHRLVSTAGFTDDLNIRLTLQEAANALPRQTFIINNEHSHTRSPPPLDLPTTSVQRAGRCSPRGVDRQ